MLKTRILSAVIMAPPALAAAWFGSPVFDVMAALIGAVMAWEWESLCTGRFGPAGIATGAGMAVSALLGASHPGLAVVAVLVTAALVLGLAARQGMTAARWLALGAIYIGLPILALVWLRADAMSGRETLFWLLLVVWATDIGAYAAGRSIGGPLLAPRISPKKTWAGLLGGMACAGLVGAGTAALLGQPGLGFMVVFSLISAAVAQVGDLAESQVKRHFGVKDSSAIIPGHGGIFDRVDGLLAAAPLAALATWAFGGGVLLWR